MDDAEFIETSIRIAVAAHAGQRDKTGNAYILHPLRVMADVRAKGGTVAQQCAAVLHDVVEDTEWSLDRLRAEDMTDDILVLVAALTHPNSESDDDYLARLVSVPGAALIKEADSSDNFNRLASITDDAMRERLHEKYTRVLSIVRAK